VDSAILAEYVGRYELAPGFVFDVALVDGQLKVKLGDQPRLTVYPESDRKFYGASGFRVGEVLEVVHPRTTSAKVERTQVSLVAATLGPSVTGMFGRNLISINEFPALRGSGLPKGTPLEDSPSQSSQADGGPCESSFRSRYPPESRKSQFYYKEVDAQITFTRDESGNMSALVLHQHGRDQTADRLE
jgi:hypothetical protein